MSDKFPIIYEDDNYLILGDDEDDMVTLILKDRGLTILFCDECWQEFMTAMGIVLRSKMGIEV